MRGAGRPGGGLTVLLAGDVMIGRGIDQILPRPGNPALREEDAASALDYVEQAERANGPIPRGVDAAYVWGDALAILHRADIDVRIANLETALTTSEDYVAKPVNFRCHPANATCLAQARFDCCALANNHALDWGRRGFLETLETLDRLGIAHAGGGGDLRAAQAPAVVPVTGKGRVLVLGMGAPSSGIPADWAAGPGEPGINCLPDFSDETVARIAELVQAARRPGDLIVASIHWGPNFGHHVSGGQRAFAHALIDVAGCHVIHGHSSHHVMPIEIHGGRPIFYGCGDFINDYEGREARPGYRSDVAAAYVCRFDPATQTLRSLDIVPFRIRRFRLATADDAALGWLWDTLERESARFGTRIAYEEGRLSAGWR